MIQASKACAEFRGSPQGHPLGYFRVNTFERSVAFAQNPLSHCSAIPGRKPERLCDYRFYESTQAPFRLSLNSKQEKFATS